MSRDGWSIDEGGVNNVLHDVQDAAESLGSALSKVMTSAQDLGPACGGTFSTVAKAVFDLIDSNGTQFAQVSSRIPAVLEATQNATAAYHQGDLDMAADAQHQASRVGLGSSSGGRDRQVK